jgi:hypothetical protein
MRKINSLLLIFSLALSTGLPTSVFAAAKAEGTKKASKRAHKAGEAPSPASLVNDMQKAFAFTVMNAKDKISTKSKEARPFWVALKAGSEALGEMEAGLKGNNQKAVQGLDKLGHSMTQLCATWAVLRSSHPGLQVGRGIIALSEAYETYSSHFGPTVARYKKGGQVTKDEMALVGSALAQLAKLNHQIEAIKAKTKANSNERRLVQDLAMLSKKLLDVKVSNLKSYCKFLYQSNRLGNAMSGYSEVFEVWYPTLYTEWQVVSTEYEVVWTSFSEISVSYYEGWAYTETSVASYGDYYERTAAVSTITEEQETQFESYSESYSEASATEESSEELEAISEEVEVSEDDDTTTFQEVEDSDSDEDGDGVDDEDDEDDDNDGINDDSDEDDDGDGVSDDEDEDEDEDADDEEDEEDEDADDDGIDDDCDGGEE